MILCLLLGLAACQTGQKPAPGTDPEPVESTEESAISELMETERPEEDSFLTPTEEEILQAFDHELAEEWFEASLLYEKLAATSVQPERSAFLIKAALMYYYGELYEDIDPFFEGLSESDILARDEKYKQTIQAGGYFGLGKIYQSLLTLPEIEELTDYRFKALALNIRSRGVLAIGKPMESAKLRMQISQLLKTPQEIEKNHDFIWDALNRITETTMLRSLNEPQSMEVRGWLELNLIARRSNMLPAKMEPWIDQWYQRYGDHPAAQIYAINLLEESKRIFIEPSKIALMLPFSGRLEKAANAIQNGFLYAYYQDPEQIAEIEIINASDDPAEFTLQYEQAIQNGADFIVGPISKELVDMLQKREVLEVPTLALNYATEEDESDLNLYQFSLRPEDEAEQIADIALTQGKHHALVLVPNTEWGFRMQNAFTRRFESLGGQVVGAAAYPGDQSDYSASIKGLLNLTNSDHRKSMLQQVIKEQVQFEARRRQDVDMIFIAANPTQARQIKPQLEFHHAQDLPVYATSRISSSNREPEKDRDLNGILFVDMPWMLASQGNVDHAEISRLWPGESKRFSRFYAWGIDSYRIIPSLRRLMLNPLESQAHYTGLLSIDEHGRVRRSLLMATYAKGQTKLLETPDTFHLTGTLSP